MVTHTDTCSFTEWRIYPGIGRRFIAKDGRLYFFISNKARQMYHQKKKAVKLTWTTAWRRFNKKIRVDETNKKRSRKTVRVQKSIVGMNLADIQRKKQETPDERQKLHDTEVNAVKARKMKAVQEKKDKMAKMAKSQPKNAAPKAKNAPAAKMQGKR